MLLFVYAGPDSTGVSSASADVPGLSASDAVSQDGGKPKPRQNPEQSSHCYSGLKVQGLSRSCFCFYLALISLSDLGKCFSTAAFKSFYSKIVPLIFWL